MFYLMIHSTHFSYGYMASNIMVKDHSENLSEYKQGIVCMHYITDRIAHATAFVTSVVEHWLE